MKRVIPAYKNLVDVLQDAIDKEADAEQFYAEASELAPEPEVKQFLLELAAMERQHFLLLSEKLEVLQAGRTVMNGILSSYDEQLDEQ
jgi:rubrerythrin